MRNHLVPAMLKPGAVWLLPLALVAGSASAVVAQTKVVRPECTCQNLESLQQEYQNAVYLEGYMTRLAEHLRAVETRQRGLNTSTNADPDQGVAVGSASAKARDAYKDANLKLPFPQPKDYKGPAEVSMTKGECTQPQDQLEAMQKGSPCQAIAEAALGHELAHTEICRALGADAYWTRLPSQLSLEEARIYKQQAARLKDELRRVMDVSDLRLVVEFRTTIGDGTGTVTDEITYDSGDLKLASQGGDRWTMTGTGETVSMMVMESRRSNSEGVCTSDPTRQDFSVSLRTDGLTADVELTGHPSRDVLLTCSAGLSLPYAGGEFGDRRVERLPVAMGDTPFPTENDWLLSAIMGAAASGGASMATVQSTILRLTCEGH